MHVDSVLGLPISTCLADASVLDATVATAPPAGFSHSWGHRMAASLGQDFLLLRGTDRRRLEAVYTLLRLVRTRVHTSPWLLR